MSVGPSRELDKVPPVYEVQVRGRVISIELVRRLLFLRHCVIELEISEADRMRLEEVQKVSGYDGGAWDVSQTLFVRLKPNERVTIGEDAHLSVVLKSQAAVSTWTVRGYVTSIPHESVTYLEAERPAA